MVEKRSLQNFVACLWFVAIVAVNFAFAQQATDARQEQLVAAMASGSEEQRLEALIELGSLLSATTATTQTASALSGILQRDSSAVMKALAARAMEFSRDGQFVPALLSSLKSEKDVSVSKAIIYGLARHRSSETVAALVARLNDKQQDIRAAAAYALSELADTASTNALIEVLKKRGKDEEAFARSRAALGLGKIADRMAIDVLLSALQKDKSAEVRREAARSLGLIASSQDVKVVEVLKQARLQPDPYLANAATLSLGRLKP